MLGKSPLRPMLNLKVSKPELNKALSIKVYFHDSNSVFTCMLLEPPTFSKRFESATAVLGNTVKLQGTIKGSAPITVKWMRDSEILRDDYPNIKMVFENNVASLEITTVAINHGGKYLCQAENEAGHQKCEATLTVQGQMTPCIRINCI